MIELLQFMHELQIKNLVNESKRSKQKSKKKLLTNRKLISNGCGKCLIRFQAK